MHAQEAAKAPAMIQAIVSKDDDEALSFARSWRRLDEANGGRAEDRRSKCGRQSRWLLVQGIMDARTV